MRVTIDGSGAILTHGDSLSGAGVIEFPVNEPPEFASTLAPTPSPAPRPLESSSTRATRSRSRRQPSTAERVPDTGGSFAGGTISNLVTIDAAAVASADVPTFRIVPPSDQTDTGDAVFVIVDPGQSSHIDNGVFEITADGWLYLGKNGAYPQQLGQGSLSVGAPPDFSGSVHITADGTGTYPFRIRLVDADNLELVTLYFMTDGTLAYYAGGTSAFEVRPDGTVHIKTGTSIVADL
jgi:hypothetical protein